MWRGLRRFAHCETRERDTVGAVYDRALFLESTNSVDASTAIWNRRPPIWNIISVIDECRVMFQIGGRRFQIAVEECFCLVVVSSLPVRSNAELDFAWSKPVARAGDLAENRTRRVRVDVRP